MIPRYNLNKHLLFLSLCILFFSCKESPLNTIDCSDYGYFEDDCGECAQCNEDCDCDLEECDFNQSQDDCGECNGNNLSCTDCMDDIAFNYNQNALIPCMDCCIYNIYIVFSDEEGFEPQLHQTSIGVPIYWLNSSNHSILIETDNSSQPGCEQNLDSFISNSSCSTYLNIDQCQIQNEGCIWNIPASYNPAWDNFQIEVPAGTSTNSQIQYYFSGFNYPSGYGYYYQYGEGNNDKHYGYININD